MDAAMSSYFQRVDAGLYAGHLSLELNLLSRDAARALTADLHGHPVVALLDGLVLASPAGLNPLSGSLNAGERLVVPLANAPAAVVEQDDRARPERRDAHAGLASVATIGRCHETGALLVPCQDQANLR